MGVLSHSSWQYDGFNGLDDTADAFCTGRFSGPDLQKVIAGIAYKQDEGAKLAIRRIDIDREDGGGVLTLSSGSAKNLQELVEQSPLRNHTEPGMLIFGEFETAGRAADPETTRKKK